MISFGIMESVVVEVGMKKKSYHERNLSRTVSIQSRKRKKRKHVLVI